MATRSRDVTTTVRSTSGGMSFTKRVIGAQRSPSVMHATGNAGQKSAQLWSAVALQQHMLRSIKGMPQGQSVPPPRAGKLTLAEKMGLVEAPPPPPTDVQWENAVAKSLHRNDCGHECSICQVAFVASSTSAQVILSCSHVFHEMCIKQFEKFVRLSGAAACCPICRAARYHKRVHYEGKAQVQHHAAAKIQALVRGVLQRKRYLTMRLRKDPKFRMDYTLTTMRALSDCYTVQAVAREKHVDKFLEELDLTRQKAVADLFSKKDWEAVRHKVLSRHDGVECPICMGQIDAEDQHEVTTSSRSRAAPEAYILSCAHCFHGPCLESFEKFAAAAVPSNSDGAKSIIPRCPVCRSGYARRSLIED